MQPREYWEILDAFCEQPGMYAVTPEAAHGTCETLGAALIAQAKGLSMWEAWREVRKVIDEVTSEVPKKGKEQPVLLCDTQAYPIREVSWAAFHAHLVEFVARLRRELSEN